MIRATLYILSCFAFSSFQIANNQVRLIFEEEKSMRSSFCLYSDGKFYESSASGCIGQNFSHGVWTNSNDTITLNYQTENIFQFDVLKSQETKNEYQIIRVLDCYNQPVRFQNFWIDTSSYNLYNPGILKIKKGKTVYYSQPIFDDDDRIVETLISNSDSITYKWRCNRETIESINGGNLYIETESRTKRDILKEKKLIPVR